MANPEGKQETAMEEEQEQMLARQEKLAALKAAIETGSYQPDLKAITDALLRALAEEELQRRRQELKGQAQLLEGSEIGAADLPEAGTEEEA